MSENIQISDEDLREFASATEGELPTFHPLLKVWREVLKPAQTERNNKVTPAFASRIVNSYREINFADMGEYVERYFDKILELANVLEEEIATDDQCLSYTTPEEDLEHNSTHYKNMLLNWQLTIVQWEKDWDHTDPHAGVELAAISEVHRMFFDQTGLVSFLDNIKFQFDEGDQAALAEALQELKESK